MLEPVSGGDAGAGGSVGGATGGTVFVGVGAVPAVDSPKG